MDCSRIHLQGNCCVHLKCSCGEVQNATEANGANVEPAPIPGADLGQLNAVAGAGEPEEPESLLSKLANQRPDDIGFLDIDVVRQNVPAGDLKVESYLQIECLWRIKQEPLYKLAFEEWERLEDFLYNRQARSEFRNQVIHSQLYNIIGWFAVFQGVVLTSVSQMSPSPFESTISTPLCGKAWMPITLTGFATFVTIIGILLKFADIRDLENKTRITQSAQQEAANRVSYLRQLGPSHFEFSKHTSNIRPYRKRSSWKILLNISVIVSVLAFTGLLILSYFVILCDTWVVRKWDEGL